MERARSKALPAAAARRKDRLGALAEGAPGLQPDEVQDGHSLHAYRRRGADAELHLRFTDRRQVTRAGSGSLLALLAGVWLLATWWVRRRRERPAS